MYNIGILQDNQTVYKVNWCEVCTCVSYCASWENNLVGLGSAFNLEKIVLNLQKVAGRWKVFLKKKLYSK